MTFGDQWDCGWVYGYHAGRVTVHEVVGDVQRGTRQFQVRWHPVRGDVQNVGEPHDDREAAMRAGRDERDRREKSGGGL